MLNLQAISENAIAVREGRMDPDDFHDWFLDYSRGHRGARGNWVADALAAVDIVLVEYSNQEIDESRLGEELANAIRPFAPKSKPASVDRLNIYQIGRPGPAKAYSVDSGRYCEWNFSDAPAY